MMNATPRLRSAYPSTPLQGRNSPQSDGSPKTPNSSKLPDVTSLAPVKAQPTAPLIPFDIVDAPSQRLYAAGIFILLWVWRFYDWSSLMADEEESLWMFMKWLILDLAYLYFLEAAHIPWLEFGVTTQTAFFSIHAILNALLMFRVPIPFFAWLGALTNYLWDSELAISGNSVKYSNVINNSSLILGRQIIHVLPEGSAVLNPDHVPICLDLAKASPSATIPLRINQTNPISIELVRFDLESSQNETLTISSSQAKRLRRDALKGKQLQPSNPVTLRVPVKKTGLYRLSKMTDETHMEVQLRHSSEALVVVCPTASISSPSIDRCKGDLSDLSIEVVGTPPLRVKYRKTVRNHDVERSYQSIQPDDFVSPMMQQSGGSGTLVVRDTFDLHWAHAHRVKVPLNETLEEDGRWIYSIEEVIDALDNTVLYSSEASDRSKTNIPSGQGLLVHDRPKIALQGHDMQKPVRVPKGHAVGLPFRLTSTKSSPIMDTEHILVYQFTPIEDMPQNGEHAAHAEFKEVRMKSTGQAPKVEEPGLYTLISISTAFCKGEVLEPSSFMLINPPEPDLSIVTERISDQCEGKAVGSRVNLDLTGTPPFRVQYIVKQKGRRGIQTHVKDVNSLRGQIEFRPEEAGEYVYTFTEISDSVYKGISLAHKSLELSQEVKPAPFARFLDPAPKAKMCIDQPASFDVRFQGEGPWTLEYEIVHGGKRIKQRDEGIAQDQYRITTPPLHNGGEYSIVLTGVTDTSKCRKALQQDAKVQVRHQRPKASFGPIEGNKAVKTLEDKPIEIPLRLTGEGPWTVDYRFVNGDTVTEHTKRLANTNDVLSTKAPGRYELLGVHDSVCPGTIDGASNTFEIAWIDRPVFKISQNHVNQQEGDSFVRREICEGEEDSLDVFLTGRPPFDLKYVQGVTYENGHQAIMSSKEMHVLQSATQIRMDSSKAGLYDYTFTELGDYNYDHNTKRHSPLKVRQRVHGRPMGTFQSPGKVYSVCQSQNADQPASEFEIIPFKFLSGEPPFNLELELTRPGRSARAEVISFSNIESRDYDIHLPSNRLRPGNAVLTVRRIRDGRGCERIVDPISSPRVQISVHDLPNIQPVEERTHFCVGERIAFSISGVQPFSIFYNFEGKQRKATEATPTFRRLAESPGNFTIVGLQDSISSCRRTVSLTKVIHPMPFVRLSKGKESRVDIHAGGEADITFDFGGQPPFEFTYIRTENVGTGEKKKRNGALLESKTLVSDERSLTIKASDEGTYEVIAIRDSYCSFTKPGYEGIAGGGRLLLKNG